MRPGLSAVVACIFASLLFPAGRVSAHAEPQRADPPINGRAATVPTKLEVWFSEEVDTADVMLTVKAPDGTVVDQGETAVDLFDPERRHVTVSLTPNLGPGTYVVEWHTRSAIDGDAADGFFSFTIVSGSPVASPGASPAATAAGTPVPATPTLPASSIVLDPTATVAPVATDDEGDFDTGAFLLAVLVGLVAAGGIYLFWRLVRPKPAR